MCRVSISLTEDPGYTRSLDLIRFASSLLLKRKRKGSKIFGAQKARQIGWTEAGKDISRAGYRWHSTHRAEPQPACKMSAEPPANFDALQALWQHLCVANGALGFSIERSPTEKFIMKTALLQWQFAILEMCWASLLAVLHPPPSPQRSLQKLSAPKN